MWPFKSKAQKARERQEAVAKAAQRREARYVEEREYLDRYLLQEAQRIQASKAEQAPVQQGARPGQQPPKPKPYQNTHYDRQVVEYVRNATRDNVWYYRDRLNVARGPCTLPVMRECWVNGVIDENTLVWGQGLFDFLPICNVRTLVPQIRTLEVQFVTWMKKNLVLKPALKRIRQERAAQRIRATDQIADMY